MKNDNGYLPVEQILGLKEAADGVGHEVSCRIGCCGGDEGQACMVKAYLDGERYETGCAIIREAELGGESSFHSILIWVSVAAPSWLLFWL